MEGIATQSGVGEMPLQVMGNWVYGVTEVPLGNLESVENEVLMGIEVLQQEGIE